MTDGANGVAGLRARRLCRLKRAGPVVVAFMGLFLVAAACSSGSTGPGVASLGATTSTTTASALSGGGIGSANYTDAVAYAQCMRTHGVPNMPDPNSKGEFLSYHGKLNGENVDARSALFSAADRACRHLLPNGGRLSAAEQQQMLAATLKFVTCLRVHGLPTFPDPVVSGGGIAIRPPSGLRPDSPQLQAAQRACQSLMPGGGP
jgi:hypothetical protein